MKDWTDFNPPEGGLLECEGCGTLIDERIVIHGDGLCYECRHKKEDGHDA